MLAMRNARGVIGLLAMLACLAVSVEWVRAQAPAPVVEPAAVAAEGQLKAIPSRNFLQIIHAGGILMVPILFCSVIMVVFLFERVVALRRGRVIPGPFIKRFMHQLKDGQLSRDEALELCEDNPSPVAEVFAAAVRKWGKPSVEVEQALLDEGERAAGGLRSYVRVFNAVSTISPLLGLLGTVFGMITAFNDIAGSDAMGRPELLAAGISEALITTAAGLIVAIPALTLYLFFISRVDALVTEIDAMGKTVVQLISAEGLADRAPSRKRREAA